MRLNIILGIDIDTNKWIEKIKCLDNEGLIAVVDFEYKGSEYVKEDILYLSCNDGKDFAKKFKEVYYYKSLYAYPMLGGTMNSLYK